MKETNTDGNTVECSAARLNSEVTIKFVPSTYNHNYKLVSIGHEDPLKLFLSPPYPGNQYQVKVNLFTSADILIESMMVNLTTVYGSALEQADM